MSKKGQRPQRSCLGCGRRDDQRNLIRLVAAEQSLRIDAQAHGRGGYLHRAEVCWQAFIRRKSLHRAFRTAISKDAKEEVVQELKQRYVEYK